jgi:hypothetical protein
MGVQQLALKCEKCGEVTTHTRQTPNHVMHALIALFTVGIWIIPWIYVAVTAENEPARCANCGRQRQLHGGVSRSGAGPMVVKPGSPLDRGYRRRNADGSLKDE